MLRSQIASSPFLAMLKRTYALLVLHPLWPITHSVLNSQSTHGSHWMKRWTKGSLYLEPGTCLGLSHSHPLMNRHSCITLQWELKVGVWLEDIYEISSEVFCYWCPDRYAEADTNFSKFLFFPKSQNFIISNECCQLFTLQLQGHSACFQNTVFQRCKIDCSKCALHSSRKSILQWKSRCPCFPLKHFGVLWPKSAALFLLQDKCYSHAFHTHTAQDHKTLNPEQKLSNQGHSSVKLCFSFPFCLQAHRD